MLLYSTNNRHNKVDLKEAVMNAFPEDRGLYMPVDIPQLSTSFINGLDDMSFIEIAYHVSHAMIGDYIPRKDLMGIIESAFDFDAPLVSLTEDIHVLELFHGPSLAFKDFGARFMASLMSYFNRGETKPLTILVATSGDTGGAVASGFYKTSGVNVVILYPSGKVSDLQEKQLTTLGHNISAFEVDGTFDDCQAIVKEAFLDNDLNKKYRLSSANSINIARLIPQSFYYFEAYKQLKDKDKKVVFSVPSGNFGNLTAGLLAKRMGLPIHKMVAATNINRVVPQYLESGIFAPKPSLATISNAMDVGNPSNFVRMMDLYGSTWNNVKADILGYSFGDAQTEIAIQEVYKKYNYVIDPHGAVAYLAIKDYLTGKEDTNGILLETAHPSKFLPTMQRVLDAEIEIPEKLSILQSLNKKAHFISKDFADFKSYMMG